MLTFRCVTSADYPQLLHWLQQPHVQEWWNDGDDTLKKVAAHYGNTTSGTQRYMVLKDGRPLGYIQYALATPDEASIDIFIGEVVELGRGQGAQILRAFILYLKAQHALCTITIDPDPANVRAIRCYTKVGFTHDETLPLPKGQAAYMMRLDLIGVMQKQQKVQLVVFLFTLVALGVILIFAEPIATCLSNWAFIKILDAVSKLGVLIAAIAFLVEILKREERAKAEKQRTQFEYWQVIDVAAAAGTSTYARKIALGNLTKEGVALLLSSMSLTTQEKSSGMLRSTQHTRKNPGLGMLKSCQIDQSFKAPLFLYRLTQATFRYRAAL